MPQGSRRTQDTRYTLFCRYEHSGRGQRGSPVRLILWCGPNKKEDSMATLFWRMKFRRPQLVIVLVSCLASLLLSATIVPPTGALIKGKVCNQSSAAILVLFSPGRVGDENIWLAPGDCTNPDEEDPDAIWGKACDAATGDCRLQVWKVGPYSVDVVDGQMVSAPARRTLIIEGRCLVDCGWAPLGWSFKPNLDDLQYELRR